jgi:glycosyltransferase involved in cell wall biosynthesis
VRISVVIPFRNEEQYIERCLRAVTSQQGIADYDVVFVLDRSTDGSVDIVRRFPSVRLLESDAAGPYAARNVGAAATDADVIAFTDADCEPRSDWLREIAAALSDEAVRAVVGARAPARDSYALSLLASYDRARDDYIFGGRRADLYYGSANNCAFRRAAFDELGGFAARRRGADMLLVRRLVERYGPNVVVYSPSVRIRHLEIEHVSDYYRKSFVYARSLQRLDGTTQGRMLHTSERLRVWRDAARQEPVSRASSTALLALLGGGMACWGVGRLTALTSGRGQMV